MALRLVDQAFLQSMMVSKALTLNETISMYNKCLMATSTQRSNKITDAYALQNRIDTINEKLRPLELQFRTLYSPWEEETYWGLCNTIEDEAVKLANMFSKHQTELLFDLIEELQDRDGLMPLVEAQNHGLEFQLTAHASANTISYLNDLKWLKVLRRHGSSAQLTFGPRALLELPKVRAWVLRRNSTNTHAEVDEPSLRHANAQMQDVNDNNDDEIVPDSPQRYDSNDVHVVHTRTSGASRRRTRQSSEEEQVVRRSRRR